MATRPITSPTSRFRLEAFDRAGTFQCVVPYRNLQAELQLNEKGAELRCEVPYRDWANITASSFYAGKHELKLVDTQTGVALFGGPIWDATVSSGTGVISVMAQDKTSYLVKRLLKTGKYYTATQPVDMMIDLLAYTNALKSTGMAASKQSSNAQTASARFNGADRDTIADLFSSIQAMGDGVEYYCRDGTLYLYGGKIIPVLNPRAISYGGDIASYSMQYNAQTISNDHDEVGSNGLIGNATDATTQADYNALFQTVNTGSNLTSSTSLSNAAATEIKTRKNTMVLATITSKSLLPVRDFDFGSQFTVYISDGYVQYNGLVRIMGCQLTIGQGDQYTTNLYFKDVAEVS